MSDSCAAANWSLHSCALVNCHPPLSARFHSILSDFLPCPQCAISDQALRLAAYLRASSHDAISFTVLYAVHKHVCFICSVCGSLSLLR